MDKHPMPPHWREMTPAQRDEELARVSKWAWGVQSVRLDLLRRRLYVAVVKIQVVTTKRRGQGRATHVLNMLTGWADDAGVILGLTPTDQWGADVDRLTAWYTDHGFSPTVTLDTSAFEVPEQLYRMPAEDDGSAELEAAELAASIADLHRTQAPRLRAVPRP